MDRTGDATRFAAAVLISCTIAAACTVPAVSQQSEEQRIAEINRMIMEKGYSWKATRTSVTFLLGEREEVLFPPLPPLPPEMLQDIPVIRAPAGTTYPPVFDWRDMGGVTPAKHQHVTYLGDTVRCASCFAHAGCGQLESFILIYDGREEDLSEQQIICCNKCPQYGCCGSGGHMGIVYTTFMYPGSVSEECMPYEANQNLPCTETQCAVHGRISGYYMVASDENSYKQALLMGPIICDMHASHPFLAYESGCYEEENVGSFNHSVLLVGWDDTACDGHGAWIIKNSYGTQWGYDGFGYVKYGTCDIPSRASQIMYIQSPVLDLYVTRPNGREVWAAGSQYMIKWYSVPISGHFEIGYYNGAAYHVIDDGIGKESREYPWTVPDDITEECTIEVAAYDSLGIELAYDQSNDCFIICEPRIEWELAGAAASNMASVQYDPQNTSDGAGGAIIAWRDNRNAEYHIYANRIHSDGGTWLTDKRISFVSFFCDLQEAQAENPEIVPDGAGGAIITWQFYTDASQGSRQIYAQRINAAGNLQWGGCGVAIAAGSSGQVHQLIIPDGSGGAIVTWEDVRGSDKDIYAQKIDSNGNVQWGPGGTAVCTATGYQQQPHLTSDGAGGAIIAWEDPRGGNPDIYAQRIDAGGNQLWAADGAAVCSAPSSQTALKIISDGAGGAIIAWEDLRTEENDIYAQRIDAGGTAQWGTDGLAVCSATGRQFRPNVTTDGAGGAIFAWYDERVKCTIDLEEGTCDDYNIYAQRIDANGASRWTADGIVVCNVKGKQTEVMITHDGAGGAVVLWRDWRDGDVNIYMQRITSYGTVLWYDNGEPLCTQGNDQQSIQVTTEHTGGIVVSWYDTRNMYPNVFAQKIAGDFPTLPRCSVSAAIVRDGQQYCVPGTHLFGCPQGDGGDTLKVKCDFNDEDMESGSIVEPGEIILDTGGLGFSFCDDGGIDSAATQENGFTVTLIRTHIRGCSDCRGAGCPQENGLPQDLPVLYRGGCIGLIDSVSARSTDVNGDGTVDVQEVDGIGSTYHKMPGDPAYNGCYDFNNDSGVNLSDLAFLGSHYDHSCPAAAPAPLWAEAPESGTGIRLAAHGPDGTGNLQRLSVTVCIENVDRLSSAAIGIRSGTPSLAYAGWTPNPDCPVTAAAVQVDRDGREEIFLAVFGLSGISSASLEIGTLEYAVPGDFLTQGGPAPCAEDIILAFGDILDTDGNVRRIAGAGYTVDVPVCSNYLGNAYPNPFNPITTIEYSIRERGHVSLRIYNAAGQLVRTLVDGVQSPAGSVCTVRWDGRSGSGRPVSSGVYFYRLVSPGFTQTKKMVLLR